MAATPSLQDPNLRPFVVSVIGPSSADASLLEAAEELGRGIAREGWVLLTGGRGGVMEAACRGARLEGGITVGLLPSGDRNQANPWVMIALPTGLGDARNLAVALGGSAVVAMGRSCGTLTEMGFASTYQRPLITLRHENPPAELKTLSADSVQSALRILRELPCLQERNPR